VISDTGRSDDGVAWDAYHAVTATHYDEMYGAARPDQQQGEVMGGGSYVNEVNLVEIVTGPVKGGGGGRNPEEVVAFVPEGDRLLVIEKCDSYFGAWLTIEQVGELIEFLQEQKQRMVDVRDF
jgi:hypothetical protein